MQDSSDFQKENFSDTKNWRKPSEKNLLIVFFNLYVCLLACCCFSCFLTKKAMAINQFHY